MREELAAWVLHRIDPQLSAAAEAYFDEMARWCTVLLSRDGDDVDWALKVTFEDGLSAGEIAILKSVLFRTTLLKQAVMLTFDEPDFHIQEVPAGGIGSRRVVSRHQYIRYRITVNTTSGKHFDLQLILREDLDEPSVRETMFWMIAIGGYAQGSPVLPRFGCARPESGRDGRSLRERPDRVGTDSGVYERTTESRVPSGRPRLAKAVHPRLQRDLPSLAKQRFPNYPGRGRPGQCRGPRTRFSAGFLGPLADRLGAVCEHHVTRQTDCPQLLRVHGR